MARRAPARLRGRRPPRRLCRTGPRPPHDAPAEPRRSSQRRAAMRGAAARAAMAASSGPPPSSVTVSERPASGAGGCWPPAAPAPGAELTLISDVLASSRSQPLQSRYHERPSLTGSCLGNPHYIRTRQTRWNCFCLNRSRNRPSECLDRTKTLF